MKYLLSIAILSTVLLSNEEFNIENDFLNSLNEVSEIATKSKLNIDDSPSFVTVLQSEKLQKLGIDTVFEALAQVPGVQVKREASGVPVVIFRGVSQKGEVKLMVDGVTINNTYRGSIYHYLDFPIEMVERIEVIRGAGSVLYGSGAMSGVINIITKNANSESRNSVFISAGSYNTYKSGAIVSTRLGDVKLAFDAYYKKSKNFTDDIDRHSDDFSIGLKIEDEHLSLIARAKQISDGNFYGILGIPDTDKNKYYNKNGAFFTQLTYHNTLYKRTQINILTGHNRYGQNIETIHPLSGNIKSTYQEFSSFAQVDIQSTFIPSNEFLIGCKYESVQVKESAWAWTHSNPTLPKYNVFPSSTRDITSLYANDRYTFSRALDISVGLRFDDYSDFGDAFSPTLGMIYKINNQLRIKALYSQAYRAPSWVEITSNPNINFKAETSSSYEAGIIYNNNVHSSIRLNLYATRIDNLITKNTYYIQSEYADFKGAEVEYIFTPDNQLELNLFASYVQAHDSQGEDLADIANTLARASLLYEFNSGISIGTLLKYVSSSTNSTIFDTTLSYRFKDMTGSLIIKDLFDKGTYYSLPTTTTTDNYFNDGARAILLKASWEF